MAQQSAVQQTRRMSANGHGSGNEDGRRFVRKHLLNLDAYQPIEPFDVLSKRLGRPPTDIVKLDANENPYGPPPEVYEALSSLPFPHVYPDPECRKLRQALAHESNVPAENIIAGAGADELIDLVFRTCVEVGETVVNTPPTFGMYKFDADVNGAHIVDVKRSFHDAFRLNIDAVISAVQQHNAKLVFLASPNNPDGGIVSDEELLHLLQLKDCLVVIDEAYIEFSGCASRMEWCLEYDNLIVLRTFSKRAALAGMRVGYAAVPSSLMEFLWRAKQPYNVSVAAETAALASLNNPAHQFEVHQKLIDERNRLYQRLRDEVDFVHPMPSNANFLLCQVIGRDAKEIKDRLAWEDGIMIRYYDKPEELQNCFRISVGKPEHTDALIDALQSK